jgi:hypothetical protein
MDFVVTISCLHARWDQSDQRPVTGLLAWDPHDRIRSILRRHVVIDHEETFAAGPSDWEYHVAQARLHP